MHKYRLEWLPGPKGYIKWYVQSLVILILFVEINQCAMKIRTLLLLLSSYVLKSCDNNQEELFRVLYAVDSFPPTYISVSSFPPQTPILYSSSPFPSCTLLCSPSISLFSWSYYILSSITHIFLPVSFTERYLDDHFIYSIAANALNATDALIPEEPM